MIAKPNIIITQTSVAAAARRDGATPEASMVSTEVPAEAAPTPTARKPSDAKREPRKGCAERDAAARDEAARRQNRHAGDDQRRALAGDIAAVPKGGAQDLHGVVGADQQPRHQRRQRQLHHHDAVERRNHHHHDRAERGLDEAEPQDGTPAQAVHAAPPECKAKALTSMPST